MGRTTTTRTTMKGTSFWRANQISKQRRKREREGGKKRDEREGRESANHKGSRERGGRGEGRREDINLFQSKINFCLL